MTQMSILLSARGGVRTRTMLKCQASRADDNRVEIVSRALGAMFWQCYVLGVVNMCAFKLRP